MARSFSTRQFGFQSGVQQVNHAPIVAVAILMLFWTSAFAQDNLARIKELESQIELTVKQKPKSKAERDFRKTELKRLRGELSNLKSGKVETSKYSGDAAIVDRATRKAIESMRARRFKLVQILEHSKRGLINPRARGTLHGTTSTTYRSQEDKDRDIDRNEKAIASLDERVARYERKEEFYFGSLDPPFKSGDFGHQDHFRVVQVIDENSMLVEFSVASDGQAGRVNFHKHLVKIKMPTAGYTDDKYVEDFKGVFRVGETETYTTALGSSNTVHVFELMDTSEIVATLKK